jgi:predicted nucleotidyltransferase
MVILFGSHARGDWVEDFQETYEYVSDFDILIVTKDRRLRKGTKGGAIWTRNYQKIKTLRKPTLFSTAFGL